VALLPIIVGAGKLARTPLGRKIGAGLIKGARKLLGGRVARTVTKAAQSKAVRRAVKGGAKLIGAGAGLEAGSEIVRRRMGGAPQGEAPVEIGPDGAVMGAPGDIESDGRGHWYVRMPLATPITERRRRVLGWDAGGNPIFPKPRINPLNPRALARAQRRVTSFGSRAQSALEQLARQARKVTPARRRAAPRGQYGHKAGCGCVVCRRRAAS